MTPLQHEVLEVARALIRFDTSNAPEAALGRLPGDETGPATYLRDLLTGVGIDCELVARDPRRANVVARIPGSDPSAPSLAFVGHLDVVPADPRDWTHPPFAAVVDEGGWLWGRGAIDMKNEVAARAVAMVEPLVRASARAATSGSSPSPTRRTALPTSGCGGCSRCAPTSAPDLAINEGGGERLPLPDGRVVQTVSIGEKGTFPARVVALGEAGHASTPDVGDNAVPLLGELLRRIGCGMPRHAPSALVDRTLEVLLGEPVTDFAAAASSAARLHPVLAHALPALAGTTMAPTLLTGSPKRNVMPARAAFELDCRILPGTTEADVEREVRARLGSDIAYELEWPEALVAGSASDPASALMDAISRVLAASGDDAALLPMMCTGFTDSVYLRADRTPTAYGFSPFRSTSAEVLTAGFHNADERVHIDDLLLAVEFHTALARDLLG